MSRHICEQRLCAPICWKSRWSEERKEFREIREFREFREDRNLIPKFPNFLSLSNFLKFSNLPNHPKKTNCDPYGPQLLLYIGIRLLDVKIEQRVVTNSETVVVASLRLEL